VNTLGLELVHDPDPAFDTIEVGRHVESVECNITGPELEECVARRKQVRARVPPAAVGERQIGLAGLMRDYGEFHAVRVGNGR
jgi:hypothetical protein